MKPAILPPLLREVIIGFWLVTVAAAFWGPYFGLETGGLVAVYGVVLLLTIGVLALQQVSAGGHGREDKPRG